MKKKIYMPFIAGQAGADIYFDRLVSSIKSKNYCFKVDKFSYCDVFLRKVKGGQNYDLVHTNDETGDNFYIKNKPFMITVHHSVFEPYYQKYNSFIKKIFYNLFIYKYVKTAVQKATKIIAVSKYTKQSIQNVFGDYNIKVIYNGIDTKKFRPFKIKERRDERIKLLFVGNLIKRKGVDLLPKIMERLGKNYVLYYTSGLRTRISNAFKLVNMIPLGKISEKDLIREYNKCDIFVFPTRLEGFGYAVAEAMACGKPVITTNCSSMPELIVDGKGGFLCEIDNVDDFVEKIRILAKDENLRKRMGKFNRERVLENFTLEVMGKKYVNLYKKLVK